MKATLF